jgi:hypothetical protein
MGESSDIEFVWNSMKLLFFFLKPYMSLWMINSCQTSNVRYGNNNNNNKLFPFRRQSYGHEIFVMYVLCCHIKSNPLYSMDWILAALVVHYWTRGCAQSAIEHFYIIRGQYTGNLLYYIGTLKWATH